jgi:hypothetical protein
MRGGVTQYYAALTFILENFDENIHLTFIKVHAKFYIKDFLGVTSPHNIVIIFSVKFKIPFFT